MRRNLAILVSILAACGLLTGCPATPKAKGSSRTIVVLGDPRLVYEGAKTNPDIDLAFFDMPVVRLVSVLELVEKEATDLGRAINPEKENAPTGKGEAENIPSLVFNVKTDREKQSVSLVMTNPRLRLTLLKIPGSPTKVEIESPNQKGAGELVHFSKSADGNHFSLLLYSEDKADGKTVSAVKFARVQTSSPTRKISEKFNYVLGPGVRAGWSKQQPVKFSICGRANGYAPQIKAAVNKWGEALQGLLTLEIAGADEFYPFSDLTQHCIYFVPNYLSDPRPDYAESGATANTINLSTYEFVDSDILIFEKELEKARVHSGPEFMRTYMDRILLHEYGHALGLDHQFNGTPSIMSYGRDVRPTLAPYDIQAIRALYE